MLHPDTNELFQQGIKPIFDLDVSLESLLYYMLLIHMLILLGRVNPLYYVTFTTATLCASFILFHGFNTTDRVNTISLLCGFLVIFSGVYLLNLSRTDPDGKSLAGKTDEEDGVPTDGIASIQTRRSLQNRRSIDRHRRSSSSLNYYGGPSDREGLMRSYDVETGAFGLQDLTEESDRDDQEDSTQKRNGSALPPILPKDPET